LYAGKDGVSGRKKPTRLHRYGKLIFNGGLRSDPEARISDGTRSPWGRGRERKREHLRSIDSRGGAGEASDKGEGKRRRNSL